MALQNDIICWWSGGITSAVACKVALDLYGIDRCLFIMIDTRNEDEDTYRFKKDCEAWYGKNIEVIDNFGERYNNIQDVWRKYVSLNVAHGAVCSSELKRIAREKWQRENEYTHQVFGFEFDKKEFNRANGMKLNHAKSKPIFPLMMLGYDKEDCINLVRVEGIKPPRAYGWGFNNNNCLGTGCVQGGIGYWQKMAIDFPLKFDTMANMEHELTDLKGHPVTMLKDQSNKAKKAQKVHKYANLVFLKEHPEYPELKCLKDMKARVVLPLMECNGFCGVNELDVKNDTVNELNFEGAIL